MNSIVDALKAEVGARAVLADPAAIRPYRTGFRYGSGAALAVVRPRTLVQQWRALRTCVAANTAVIFQAANTGLTGGSTPASRDYDREVVIINTLRISKIFVIEEGRQVICLPGATLHQLEQVLAPLKREPHSVIGSSCIGASVIGGICNNSGGALVRRGPAYTQMALFARVNECGQLQLVNHLGVELGDEPEQMLSRLERGEFVREDISHDPERWGSDRDYSRRVRDVDAQSPARFNADDERLFEASGCAGKLAVFAVRLDTFPKDERTRTFYIGTVDPAELTGIRRHVLTRFDALPIAAEYLHRDMFDVAARFGKDTFLAIRLLGTRRLPLLLALKRRFDALITGMGFQGAGTSERWLQRLCSVLPDHLPPRMKTFRDRFDHHLILKMGEGGADEAAHFLQRQFPSGSGDFFECSEDEAAKAFLHRFVAAGAAVRYRSMHEQEVEDIVSLDVALRRDDRCWFETLPHEIRSKLILPLYYGHFFCHVFHQDYIVRKGNDAVEVKEALCKLLDARGARYPAEHNVGHLYHASAGLGAFYRALDPRNQLNPGIGLTSCRADWHE
jgi:D-lactate dehydrogenase